MLHRMDNARTPDKAEHRRQCGMLRVVRPRSIPSPSMLLCQSPVCCSVSRRATFWSPVCDSVEQQSTLRQLPGSQQISPGPLRPAMARPTPSGLVRHRPTAQTPTIQPYVRRPTDGQVPVGHSIAVSCVAVNVAEPRPPHPRPHTRTRARVLRPGRGGGRQGRRARNTCNQRPFLGSITGTANSCRSRGNVIRA